MDTLRTLLWRWVPALVVMALIFVASSQTGADLPDFGTWDWTAKKSGHVLFYALLALAYLRGLAYGRRPSLGLAATVVLMAALYGATDEFHQFYVAGRGASPVDVGIDTLGAVAGLALFWAARGLWPRRSA